MMKKLIVLFFILLAGCYSKRNGKLVPNRPSVLLCKYAVGTESCVDYYFDFYINGTAYSVYTTKGLYDKYKVGDTIHDYQVVPYK